ncbi:hypothetical protein LJC48_01625 [Desulfovibrio sp. OttesenSCG-928-C06]|nr:hypothetical protein [Desulfovibrio sp. OttesenSCG-928-C06]
MNRIAFACLLLCLCCGLFFSGCVRQAPVAVVPPDFTPMWDESDEPIAGLWQRSTLHGKIRLVSFIPYKGVVGKDGRVSRVKGPVVLSGQPVYVTTDRLLSYPIDTVKYPYMLDFGPRGLRSQTAYDAEGGKIWVLTLGNEKVDGSERPAHLMVQVTGRKDLVCLYLEYDKDGRLVEAHPVGLDDNGSKLPFISLGSCYPAHVEYKYGKDGRLAQVMSFEAVNRYIENSAKGDFAKDIVQTRRAYSYDEQGRLAGMTLVSGKGKREYSFRVDPAERRLYRISKVAAQLRPARPSHPVSPSQQGSTSQAGRTAQLALAANAGPVAPAVQSSLPEFKQYDAQGRLEQWQTVYFFRDGETLVELRSFERDAQGRVVQERVTSSKGPQGAGAAHGSNAPDSKGSRGLAGGSGGNSDAGGKRSANGAGGMNGEPAQDSGPWVREFAYEYDELGNMTRYSENRYGEPDVDVRRYEYDEHGNWVRAEYYSIHDGEHPIPEPAVLERNIRYYPD